MVDRVGIGRADICAELTFERRAFAGDQAIPFRMGFEISQMAVEIRVAAVFAGADAIGVRRFSLIAAKERVIIGVIAVRIEEPMKMFVAAIGQMHAQFAQKWTIGFGGGPIIEPIARHPQIEIRIAAISHAQNPRVIN